MSRRKQAKPRALVKSSEVDEQDVASERELVLDNQCGGYDNYQQEDEEALFIPRKRRIKGHLNEDDDVILSEVGHQGQGEGEEEDTMGTDDHTTSSHSTATSSYFSDSSDQHLGTNHNYSSSPSSPGSSTGEITFTIGPTETTPYSCSFCEKAFPRLSYLKKHEQSHSDHLPFRCDYCKRLFKHKRSRDRHVKLHTGDKKYRCPHCESAFSRSDHLKIHLKTHDHQKPYQCGVCNRGYNTAAALTSHMQNHKKGASENTNGDSSPSPSTSQYRCLQCTSHFPTGEELQGHIQQSHADVSPETVGSPAVPMNPPGSKSATQKLSSSSSSSNSPSPARNTIPQLIPPPPPLPLLPPVPTPSPNSTNTLLLDNMMMSAAAASLQNLLSSTTNTTTPFKLTCIYCKDEGFTSLESLQLHIQALHGPSLLMSSMNSDVTQDSSISSTHPQLQCSFCTMKFPSLTTLQKHILSVHSLSLYLQQQMSPSSTTCCGINFPNPSTYAEHFLIFHGKSSTVPVQSTPTDLSKKTTNKNTPPRKKSPTTTTNNTLLCNQCNAGFTDFESFRTHLKTHLLLSTDPQKTSNTTSTHTCPHCPPQNPQVFPTESLLESHLITHHYLSSTNQQSEYGCQSCLKLFTKPDELQKHLLDIHAHHLYRCSLCKEVFDSKVSIQVHFAVKHSNECKLYRCTACSNGVFRSEVEFQLHVRGVHLNKSSAFLRCLLCSATFTSEIDLQFHVSTHQKPFKCKVCEDAFHVEFLLDRHNMEVHQNGGDSVNTVGNKKRKQTHTTCDICDKKFLNEGDLLVHRRTLHNTIPPDAEDAPTDGSIVGESERKKIKHSPNRTLSLNCAYCQSGFKSRSELESHMKSHQIVGKNKCNICDEICPTPTLLAEHKLTHCKVVGGNVKCTQCKDDISSKEDYMEHNRMHNSGGGGFPAPCVVCRQTVTSPVELHLHSRFHTTTTTTATTATPPSSSSPVSTSSTSSPQQSPQNNNPPTTSYHCIKCQQTFPTEEQIQTHVTLTHLSSTNSNECTLCPRPTTFDSPLKLQCHLIEHSYEGLPYSCYLCSSVFTSPTGLQSHMISHGLHSRPYDCEVCRLKFWFRGELENHLCQEGHHQKNKGDKNKKRGRFFYRDDSEDEECSVSNGKGVKNNSRGVTAAPIVEVG